MAGGQSPSHHAKIAKPGIPSSQDNPSFKENPSFKAN
jgi:hypothetical protein